MDTATPLADVATRRELTNALRATAMDAVQRAKSGGRPGMPMGMRKAAPACGTTLRRSPSRAP